MVDSRALTDEKEPAAPAVLLSTDRLLFRRFTPADLGELCRLNGDPLVVRYLTGGEPIPRATNERFLLHYVAQYDRFPGFGVWALEERAGGEIIGWCSLWREGDGLAELGYRLVPSVWGRGYASEAARAMLNFGFTRLGLERVFASTYEDNLGSRRVMEKIGMTFVRAFRPTSADLHLTLGIADYPDRFPKLDVEYAITRSEWDTRHTNEKLIVDG